MLDEFNLDIFEYLTRLEDAFTLKDLISSYYTLYELSKIHESSQDSFKFIKILNNLIEIYLLHKNSFDKSSFDFLHDNIYFAFMNCINGYSKYLLESSNETLIIPFSQIKGIIQNLDRYLGTSGKILISMPRQFHNSNIADLRIELPEDISREISRDGHKYYLEFISWLFNNK